MKTRGIEVLDGYLLHGFKRADGSHTPSPDMVPSAFWARLKHAIAAEHLVDEFKADEAQAKTSGQARTGLTPEQALFWRWTLRLGFVLPPGHYDGELLWPWTRGWTEDAVDAYLTHKFQAVA